MIIIRLIGDEHIAEDKVVLSVTDASKPVKPFLVVIRQKLDLTGKSDDYRIWHVRTKANGKTLELDKSRPYVDINKSWAANGFKNKDFIYVREKRDDDDEVDESAAPPAAAEAAPASIPPPPPPQPSGAGGGIPPPPPMPTKTPAAPQSPPPVVPAPPSALLSQPATKKPDSPPPPPPPPPQAPAQQSGGLWSRFADAAAESDDDNDQPPPPPPPDSHQGRMSDPVGTLLGRGGGMQSGTSSGTFGGGRRVPGTTTPPPAMPSHTSTAVGMRPPASAGTSFGGARPPSAGGNFDYSPDMLPTPRGGPSALESASPGEVERCERRIRSLEDEVAQLRGRLDSRDAKIDQLQQQLLDDTKAHAVALAQADAARSSAEQAARKATESESAAVADCARLRKELETKDAELRQAQEEPTANPVAAPSAGAGGSRHFNEESLSLLDEPLRRSAQEQMAAIDADVERRRLQVAETLSFYQYAHNNVEALRARALLERERMEQRTMLAQHRASIEATVHQAVSSREWPSGSVSRHTPTNHVASPAAAPKPNATPSPFTASRSARAPPPTQQRTREWH